MKYNIYNTLNHLSVGEFLQNEIIYATTTQTKICNNTAHEKLP